jgi:uncharacterized membrane protein (DUF485 family)
MGGLDFNSNLPKEQEDAELIAYNTRLSLVLFLLYVIFYAGFMALSAFWPSTIGSPSVGGVNLSVTYGFALIAAAIILALVYMKLSRKPAIGGSK